MPCSTLSTLNKDAKPMATRPPKEESKTNRGQKEVDIEKQRKQEALRRAVDLIEKNFGSGSIQTLTSDGSRHIPSISTGSLAIDMALGVGGVPKGRVIEIFGPESSGKT